MATAHHELPTSSRPEDAHIFQAELDRLDAELAALADTPENAAARDRIMDDICWFNLRVKQCNGVDPLDWLH